MPEPTKPLLGQFLPAARAAKAVNYVRKLIPPVVKKANQTYTDVLVGRNQSHEALTLKGLTGGAHEAKRRKKPVKKK